MSANIVKSELDKQYELNDTLRADIAAHKLTIIKLEDAVAALRVAGKDKDLVNLTNSQIIDRLRELLSKAEKRLKFAKTLNKIFIPLSAALAVALVVVL